MPTARSTTLTTTLTIAYWFVAATAFAAGALDPTFGAGGRSVVFFDLGGNNFDRADDVAIQPDGKIVVAGVSGTASGELFFSIARLLKNGTLDPTFDGDGRLALDIDLIPDGSAVGRAVAVQLDGKILVGGYAQGTGTGNDWDWVIARLLADGALDPTFGTAGLAVISFDRAGGNFDSLSALAIQPDGKIVAVGTIENSNTTTAAAVARLLPDGAPDLAFGTDGRNVLNFAVGADTGGAEAVLVLEDGEILVAGSFQLDPGNDDFLLVRLTSAGVLDSSFAGSGWQLVRFDRVPSGSDRAFGLTIDARGGILVTGAVAGPTPAENDFALARLSGAGFLDSTFGQNGRLTLDSTFGTANDTSLSVAVSCGKITLAGVTLVAANDSDYSVMRTDWRGGFDLSYGDRDGRTLVPFDLGHNNEDRLDAMALDRFGRLVVVGTIDRVSVGDTDWGIARLTGDGGCLFADDFESGDFSAWSSVSL